METLDIRTARVLYVEDDRIIQRVFERIIKNSPYPLACTQAFSVTDARKALASGTFDVVVTDYLLGDGNALDYIDELQELSIIFVTGQGDEELAVEAMKRGAQDYLVKDDKNQYLEVLPEVINKAFEHNQTRRRLRESEERYRDLFEHTSDLIQMTNPEGNFLYVNPSWLQALGYDRAELAAKSFFGLVKPALRPRVERSFQKTRRQVGAFRIETVLLSRSGEEIMVDGSISARREEGSEEVIAVRGFFRDVTEQRRAHERIKKQNSILETQNRRIRDMLDEVVRASIGRRSASIVLLIAVLLFFVSEVLLEPYIEEHIDSIYVGYAFKGAIALLLKPIDVIVEKMLIRRSLKSIKAEKRRQIDEERSAAG